MAREGAKRDGDADIVAICMSGTEAESPSEQCAAPREVVPREPDKMSFSEVGRDDVGEPPPDEATRAPPKRASRALAHEHDPVLLVDHQAVRERVAEDVASSSVSGTQSPGEVLRRAAPTSLRLRRLPGRRSGSSASGDTR